MKGKITFITGIIFFVASLFFKNSLGQTIAKMSYGFLIGGVIEFVVFIIENKNRINLFKTLLFKRNSPVRLTIAYLYRIEHNGKYLLIKRQKKDNPGYQPIGGAYKYFKEEARDCFDSLGIIPCNYVPRDEDTECDLRVIIKKRRKILAFLKWLESRKSREIDPYREFYEELIEPNYLSQSIFKYIKYIYVGKNIEGVIKSPVYPIDELRYADIFEFRVENDAQKREIINLASEYPDIFLFATPEEIMRGYSLDGKTILPHTLKILPK